ncbi:MAG: PTS glucose transporter subunit IIA [Succinivibrionaceae bacterium]
MAWWNFKSEKAPETADLTLISPITGTTVPLEDVPDVVFSEKIIGDGVAIKPSGDRVVAPCNCTVVEVFKTKQAIILKTSPHDIILFIHIGIDTIDFGYSEVFNVAVQEGDFVKTGDTLIDFNLSSVQTQAKSSISPLLISTQSLERIEKFTLIDNKCIAGNNPLIQIYLKKETNNKG